MRIRGKKLHVATLFIILGMFACGAIAVSTLESARATNIKCPAPIAKWMYTPRSGVHDGVFPGQTFDVSIPKSWAGSDSTITFTKNGVIREVCSQLGGGGKQLVLFKALTVGNSEVSASLNGMPPSVLHGQIIVNPAPPQTPWPKSFSANLMVSLKGYQKPVRFGSLVAGSDTPQKSVSSITGSYGYALAYVNGFQYAVRTVDGGKSWRIDSTWFAGPWADGAAFAGTIQTFSPTIAAAAGDGQLLYVTTDAGKRWYGLFFSGVVLKVMSSGAHSFTVTLGTEDGVGAGRTYVSNDGGAHWSRTET